VGDEQLDAWARKVAQWGGRYGEPAAKSLAKEISDSQLGQLETLPTSLVATSFPATVVLAQMDLSVTMEVDVTFTNFLTQGVGGDSLDPGDGFVRVTWGTPGTFKNSVDIDVNQGWSHPFTASFLRVEYIPITQGGNFPLPVNQARDMQIGGMITPAADGPQTILTKSVLLADIPDNGFATGTIPRWARNARMTFTTVVTDPTIAVIFFDASGSSVSSFGGLGVSVSRPFWTGNIVSYPVPQRAVTFLMVVPAGSGPVGTPTLIFELDL